MGSILSKIYDDYDDYIEFCKMFNIEAKGIRDDISFYEHAENESKKLTEDQKESLKNGYLSKFI